MVSPSKTSFGSQYAIRLKGVLNEMGKVIAGRMMCKYCLDNFLVRRFDIATILLSV